MIHLTACVGVPLVRTAIRVASAAVKEMREAADAE